MPDVQTTISLSLGFPFSLDVEFNFDAINELENALNTVTPDQCVPASEELRMKHFEGNRTASVRTIHTDEPPLLVAAKDSDHIEFFVDDRTTNICLGVLKDCLCKVRETQANFIQGNPAQPVRRIF